MSYEMRDDDYGIGSVLIPTSPWDAQCAQRLQVGDVFAVRLSYSAGFRGADLSFLERFISLRSVEVYSNEVRDIKPLAGLPSLEVLGLQTGPGTQKFADCFPSLRVAKVQWRKGMEALLSNLTLEYLNVINFPYIDLLSLVQLSRLERLSLTSRKLTTLHGIENLTSLRRLDLYACQELKSIDLLAQCENIVELEVESCRYITI